MRKYVLLHVLIISFVFFLTPTIQAASDWEIDVYKQEIRINPDYADAHTHTILGLAYVFLYDRDSALEQYKILKSLDSELANKLYNMIYK